MRDIGDAQTEKLLREMEDRIKAQYEQAVKETQEKLDDYLRRFKTKDAIWQQRVAAGKATEAEYKQWRMGQIAVGKRWEEMKDTLANDLHNSNAIARSVIDGYKPEVYSLNHNFATYAIEHAGKVNTSYTLYNGAAVRKLANYDEILPPIGKQMQQRIAAGLDVAWQKGQIQSVTMQAILQGESIPNMSKRIAQTLGESNHKSTIRYARTAVTAAQNAGREDAYKRAAALGVNMMREWVATYDNRTRHEHRILDGQKRAIDEPFEADGKEIMFPGDPDCAYPEMIWNCRCRTVAAVAGWEDKVGALRSDEAVGGMTYDEWLEAKPVSQSITHQEEVAEAMRRSYINELYGGSKSGYNGSGKEPQPPQEATALEPEPEPLKEPEVRDCNSFEELREYWRDTYGFTVNTDIDNLHFEGVKQAMAGVEAGLKTCPQAAGQVKGFSTMSNGYMCSDGKTIYFNPKYFAPKKFDGDTDYAFMAGAHEYGHCLDRLLCENLAKMQGGYGWDYFMSNTVSRGIVSQAVREIKREEPNAASMTAKELRGRISQYATSDTSETVAEAFARSVTWAEDGKTRHGLGAAMCEKVTSILKGRLEAL